MKRESAQRSRRAPGARAASVAVAWLVALAMLAGACDDASRRSAATATATPVGAAPAATAPPQPAATNMPATGTPPAVPATTPAPAEVAPTAPAADGSSVTISAVGDISLAREVVARMEAGGAGYPYALITPLIDGDIAFANLEGALTERGDPWPKGYNFRTPPRFASGLRGAGFDIVSLANNHSMDYGAPGLLDSIDALRAAGVTAVGAGADADAARAYAIVEANGLRVAFIACVATPVESGGFAIEQWSATSSAPGVFVCEDGALAQAIGEARAAADFVIVTAHAGTEYRNAPDATQARIVNTALAAGADAYIGHHAHVVQPVELRGGQLVAWGLGNFIFDLDSVDLANIPVPRMSLVLKLTLTKGAGVTSWQAVPVTQDAAEDRPRPATPDEAAVLQGLVGQ